MRLILLLILMLLVAGCGGGTTATGSAGTEATAAETVTETESPTEAAAEAEATEVEEEMAEAGESDPATTTPAEVEADEVATAETDEAATGLNHARMLNQALFAEDRAEAEAALTAIRETEDTRFVVGLIDTLRYQRGLSDDIGFTLNRLTGENLQPDWFVWVEWAGQHPEIENFEGYPGWKANLFAQIDPNFLRFVNEGMQVAPDSRVEEIVWGGVRVDGIPALDNPTMIDPAEADYLVPEERVFGVSINGDTRAYPARFLDWHEMFNDVVGGEPVSLAY